ncbi:hypothetical protein QT597_22540, partial [Xanthomonas citri pv. citri]
RTPNPALKELGISFFEWGIQEDARARIALAVGDAKRFAKSGALLAQISKSASVIAPTLRLKTAKAQNIGGRAVLEGSWTQTLKTGTLRGKAWEWRDGKRVFVWFWGTSSGQSEVLPSLFQGLRASTKKPTPASPPYKWFESQMKAGLARMESINNRLQARVAD